MSVSKSEMKEQVAAAWVIQTLTGNITELWPKVIADIRRNDLDAVLDIGLLSSGLGIYEFGLACLSLELQALPNLVPSEQGRRCREHMLAILRSASSALPSDPREGIAAYECVFVQALARTENPLPPVAEEYLARVGLPATPLAAPVLAGLLVGFAGMWQTVLDTWTLVQ